MLIIFFQFDIIFMKLSEVFEVEGKLKSDAAEGNITLVVCIGKELMSCIIYVK